MVRSKVWLEDTEELSQTGGKGKKHKLMILIKSMNTPPKFNSSPVKSSTIPSIGKDRLPVPAFWIRGKLAKLWARGGIFIVNPPPSPFQPLCFNGEDRSKDETVSSLRAALTVDCSWFADGRCVFWRVEGSFFECLMWKVEGSLVKYNQPYG